MAFEQSVFSRHDSLVFREMIPIELKPFSLAA